MGKNQRFRKIEKDIRHQEEKKAVEERRKERLKPIVSTTKRVATVLIITIAIFYLGVQVNNHLAEIVDRIGKDLTIRSR